MVDRHTGLPNPRIPAALEDARVLLAYASQSGVDLDQTTVATIVATGNAVSKGELAEAQESAFWTALNALSKKLGQVSVSSLRATMDSYAPESTALFGIARWWQRGLGGQPRSLARNTVRWYTMILVGTLAALLILQIYWLFGTSITGEVQKNRKAISELEAKQRELQQRAAAIGAGKATPARANAEAAARSISSDVELMRNQLDNLDLRQNASFNLLKQWSGQWERWVRLEEACQNKDADTQVQCGNIARYDASIVVLDVLQRYFLALLYGLLGACVYILRTLTAQIRARTYSEASNIEFRIRLYLGTLGGMVVAWFLTPDVTEGLFRTLSPFALAFLAGYSVELLFAAMDRLIAAFTK